MASHRKRSRTRSGASVAQRDAERLRSLTFFLDRQLGRYTVADALRTAGAQVKIQDDHFAQNTADSVWLAAVGANDWVVISKDENIRRNPLERQAYADSESARVRDHRKGPRRTGAGRAACARVAGNGATFGRPARPVPVHDLGCRRFQETGYRSEPGATDRTLMSNVNFDLGGKVALVTGGASLLGSAIARALHAAGAAVVIADVDAR